MATINNNNQKATTYLAKEEWPADIETNTAASNEDAVVQTVNPFKSDAGDDGEANRRDLKRAMAPLESRTANPDADEQLNVASNKSSASEKEKSDDGFVDITNDAGEVE